MTSSVARIAPCSRRRRAGRAAAATTPRTPSRRSATSCRPPTTVTGTASASAALAGVHGEGDRSERRPGGGLQGPASLIKGLRLRLISIGATKVDGERRSCAPRSSRAASARAAGSSSPRRTVTGLAGVLDGDCSREARLEHRRRRRRRGAHRGAPRRSATTGSPSGTRPRRARDRHLRGDRARDAPDGAADAPARWRSSRRLRRSDRASSTAPTTSCCRARRPSAQVLLTFFDMSARTHYLNARHTLGKLLAGASCR